MNLNNLNIVIWMIAMILSVINENYIMILPIASLIIYITLNEPLEKKMDAFHAEDAK